jgi:hypothetical protein
MLSRTCSSSTEITVPRDPPPSAHLDYRVETSQDGTTWTVAKEGAFGNADHGRLNLVQPTAGAANVRYVRFTMLSQQLVAPCSGPGANPEPVGLPVRGHVRARGVRPAQLGHAAPRRAKGRIAAALRVLPRSRAAIPTVLQDRGYGGTSASGSSC